MLSSTRKLVGFGVLAILVTGGCRDGSGGGGPAQDVGGTSTEDPVPATAPAGTWYSGDLHVHSDLSTNSFWEQGDSVSVLLDMAETLGLDFIAITDHRTVDQISDPGFASGSVLAIRGEEWGDDNHAGALGIGTKVPEVDESLPPATYNTQVAAAIAHCHAQGGVWSIHHPARKGGTWVAATEGADAVEVWNAPWALQDRPVTETYVVEKSLGWTAGGPPTPEILAASRAPGTQNDQAIVFWETMLNAGRRLAIVGGGDRHSLIVIGRPTTRVFATERSEQAVLDAIRAGRTYVTYGPDGPEILLQADGDGNGTYETIVGGAVPPGPVRLRIEVRQTIGGRVDVIKNGQRLASYPVGTTATLDVTDTAEAGSWYRVDYYEPSVTEDSVAAGWKLFIQGRPLQNLDWESPYFYFTLLGLLQALPGFSVTDDYGTALPVIELREDLHRLWNLSVLDPAWCRAAITSPIYVR